MASEGHVMIKLNPTGGKLQDFPMIGKELTRYEENWRRSQPTTVLATMRIKFAFAGFVENEKGLFAKYTAKVDKI